MLSANVHICISANVQAKTTAQTSVRFIVVGVDWALVMLGWSGGWLQLLLKSKVLVQLHPTHYNRPLFQRVQWFIWSSVFFLINISPSGFTECCTILKLFCRQAAVSENETLQLDFWQTLVDSSYPQVRHSLVSHFPLILDDIKTFQFYRILSC